MVLHFYQGNPNILLIKNYSQIDEIGHLVKLFLNVKIPYNKWKMNHVTLAISLH